MLINAIDETDGNPIDYGQLSDSETESSSKDKILYIKSVHIKKDQNERTINFDLTIATIRVKKEG